MAYALSICVPSHHPVACLLSIVCLCLLVFCMPLNACTSGMGEEEPHCSSTCCLSIVLPACHLLLCWVTGREEWEGSSLQEGGRDIFSDSSKKNMGMERGEADRHLVVGSGGAWEEQNPLFPSISFLYALAYPLHSCCWLFLLSNTFSNTS